MKDFENSPYINIKSPEVQFFNKMDKSKTNSILSFIKKWEYIF
jgi:hypothetical protein